VSLRTWGVVACAPLVWTTGCSTGPVELVSPELSGPEAAACARFVAALPDTLAGQERRETSGDDEYAAAWGDPAIVVTCGVGAPVGLTDTSTCVEVDSTGWFVPDEVLNDDEETLDVTATELNHRPRVELSLPGDYRPDGFLNATGALAGVVEQTLEQSSACR